MEIDYHSFQKRPERCNIPYWYWHQFASPILNFVLQETRPHIYLQSFLPLYLNCSEKFMSDLFILTECIFIFVLKYLSLMWSSLRLL